MKRITGTLDDRILEFARQAGHAITRGELGMAISGASVADRQAALDRLVAAGRLRLVPQRPSPRWPGNTGPPAYEPTEGRR